MSNVNNPDIRITIQKRHLLLALMAVAGLSAVFSLTPAEDVIAQLATDLVCSGCVDTSDIANGAVGTAKIATGGVTASDIATGAVTNAKIGTAAVTTGKIADSTITAADIGVDAVGAEELQGVTKLIFVECVITDNNTVRTAGSAFGVGCSTAGSDPDDIGIATNNGNNCFEAGAVDIGTNAAIIILRNDCIFDIAYGSGTVALIVYDK